MGHRAALLHGLLLRAIALPLSQPSQGPTKHCLPLLQDNQANVCVLEGLGPRPGPAWARPESNLARCSLLLAPPSPISQQDHHVGKMALL